VPTPMNSSPCWYKQCIYEVYGRVLVVMNLGLWDIHLSSSPSSIPLWLVPMNQDETPWQVRRLSCSCQLSVALFCIKWGLFHLLFMEWETPSII
jgi:hypothetical protein